MHVVLGSKGVIRHRQVPCTFSEGEILTSREVHDCRIHDALQLDKASWSHIGRMGLIRKMAQPTGIDLVIAVTGQYISFDLSCSTAKQVCLNISCLENPSLSIRKTSPCLPKQSNYEKQDGASKRD